MDGARPHGGSRAVVYSSLALALLCLAAAWTVPSLHMGHAAALLQSSAYVGQAAAEPATSLGAKEESLAAVPPDFKYVKVVAVIAFDRFNYFRRVMEGLQRAWGSSEYLVTVTIDGPPKNLSSFDHAGWKKIVEYSRQMQWLSRSGQGFRDVLINVSEHNLGVWPNKKRAVAHAMELTDFLVVLEDDIVLEIDGLRWFEWHVTSGLIFKREDVAIATCWANSFPLDGEYVVEGHDLLAVRTLGLLDKYFIRDWATPWGWATWKHTWQAVGANWTGQDLKLALAVQSHGWGETIPLVARCQNIGSVGIHKRGATQGHIHTRSITSSSFPAPLDKCRYTELGPLTNRSDYFAMPQGLKDLVRSGIFPAREFVNLTLQQVKDKMLEFVDSQPTPSLWYSSC